MHAGFPLLVCATPKRISERLRRPRSRPTVVEPCRRKCLPIIDHDSSQHLPQPSYPEFAPICRRTRSRLLRLRRSQSKRHLLLAQPRMLRGQNHRPSILLRTNPDRARPTYQRKRIIPKYLRRPLQRQRNRITRIRPNIVELIRHPKHHPRRIGPIRNQRRIVRQQRELLVQPASRIFPRDHQSCH